MVTETKTSSPGLKDCQNLKNIEKWTQDGEQAELMAYYFKKLNDARSQRTKNRTELDDNNYENDYELNKRAANSYLYPKANDDEVRVVTTATEKKIEVVENELMAANFQSEVFAYDNFDMQMKTLGQDFTDITNRTNSMERDERLWRAFIKELLTQRAAYLEEVDNYDVIIDRPHRSLGMDGKVPVIEDSKIDGKIRVVHRPIKRLVSGLQIYLGDDSIPAWDFQKQPFILKYTRRKWDTTKDIYQKWENWKFVQQGMPKKTDQPFGYRMNTLQADEVEEIVYMDPHKNEFMIILNGVMMFNKAVACPWTITTDRKYMMEMIILKSISNDYAYGRPLTSSSKMIQSLNDETIRLLIRKMRQAISPPVGTKSKKVFSKDIWAAGAITQGIKKDDISILNPENKGVTGSEFNMLDLFNKIITESIGTPNTAQGLEQKGDQTATEIINQQQRFAKNLGQALLSLMYAKEQMTYQRIYNLMDNFMKPIKRELDPFSDKVNNIFRKFTIENAQFENGRRGTKIVQLMDRDLKDEEKRSIFDFEQDREAKGELMRVRILNTKKISAFSIFFKVVVNQKERDGGALEKVMFKDKLEQGLLISKVTGRPINGDEVSQDFEHLWKTRNFFQKIPVAGGANQSPEAQRLRQGIEGLEGGQTKVGDQMEEFAASGVNKPSLNTIQSNVQ